MPADQARIKSFAELLQQPTSDDSSSITICELYSLRHLCLQPGGIPSGSSSSSSSNTHSLRAQAWRVLLGLLPPEKQQWSQTLAKRRDDYAHFVSTITQAPFRRERDALLDQVYRDLSRSRRNALPFYSSQASEAASSLPSTRHALLHRLAMINADYADAMAAEAAQSQSDPPRTPTQRQLSMPPNPQSPPIFLQPPSPGVGLDESRTMPHNTADTPTQAAAAAANQPTGLAAADVAPQPPSPDAPPLPIDKPVRHTPLDRRWHSLLRVLYIFATLNPSTGYVQGMGEIAFVLLYVLAHDDNAAAAPPAGLGIDAASAAEGQQTHAATYAEADAFWLFSNLMAQMRELYDFSGLQHPRDAQGQLAVQQKRGGMANALLSLSLRLKWLDEELWQQLSIHGLDPRNPYYAFRWLACLLSTELELPSVVRIWDALLAESSGSRFDDSSANEANPRVDFLIDICCALLTSLRGRLLEALQDSTTTAEDGFSRCMRILQNFANEDSTIVIEVACMFRQRRLAAPLTGDGPARQDDDSVEESAVEQTPRQRAEKVLRGWSGSARSAGWFTPRRSASVGEGFSGEGAGTPEAFAAAASSPSDASSTPSRSAFARYAEAFQSSDAAASLSKASTNGLARAMATWNNAPTPNGSRSKAGADDESDGLASPIEGQRRIPSLAGLFSRQRSDTDESGSPSLRGGSASLHPALRWSRDMPNLPLPNMSDDSPGREEYAWAGRPQSVSLGRSAGSPYSSAESPNGSPSLGAGANGGRFPNLPSLRASPAAAAVPARGPKPLLLASASRSPRAASFGSKVPPKSRKVSSGPMAAAASPRGAANRAARRESSTTTTGSYAESCSSGGDANWSRRGSSTVDADEAEADSVDSRNSRREALQTWQSAAQRISPSTPYSPSFEQSSSVTSPQLSESSVAEEAPSFADAAIRSDVVAPHANDSIAALQQHATHRNGSATQPSFGQVSSSSDIPLVPTIGRATRTRAFATKRKGSGASVLSSGATLTTEESEVGGISGANSEATTRFSTSSISRLSSSRRSSSSAASTASSRRRSAAGGEPSSTPVRKYQLEDSARIDELGPELSQPASPHESSTSRDSFFQAKFADGSGSGFAADAPLVEHSNGEAALPEPADLAAAAPYAEAPYDAAASKARSVPKLSVLLPAAAGPSSASEGSGLPSPFPPPSPGACGEIVSVDELLSQLQGVEAAQAAREGSPDSSATDDAYVGLEFDGMGSDEMQRSSSTAKRSVGALNRNSVLYKTYTRGEAQDMPEDAMDLSDDDGVAAESGEGTIMDEASERAMASIGEALTGRMI